MSLMILAAVAVLADAGSAAAQVDRLSWMAGSWIVEKDGVVTRETWLAPRDGVMSGVGQTNRPGHKPFVEFMTIAAEPGGPTFTARLPNQPPTAFVLKPGQADELVFENPAHDFPQRVIYRRCGADELCGAIEGEVKGRAERREWRYRRLK